MGGWGRPGGAPGPSAGGGGRPGPTALPHGGLVELGVGVRQGSAVAAGAAHGEGWAGAAAEHLAGHGVQRARQARLGARRVRVRDHVGEPGVVGGVRAGERRLQRAQRRRAGPRGGQEARVGRGLRLRRRAVREEVVVASRRVVIALVVCGRDGAGEGRVRDARSPRDSRDPAEETRGREPGETKARDVGRGGGHRDRTLTGDRATLIRAWRKTRGEARGDQGRPEGRRTSPGARAGQRDNQKYGKATLRGRERLRDDEEHTERFLDKERQRGDGGGGRGNTVTIPDSVLELVRDTQRARVTMTAR